MKIGAQAFWGSHRTDIDIGNFFQNIELMIGYQNSCCHWHHDISQCKLHVSKIWWINFANNDFHWLPYSPAGHSCLPCIISTAVVASILKVNAYTKVDQERAHCTLDTSWPWEGALYTEYIINEGLSIKKRREKKETKERDSYTTE